MFNFKELKKGESVEGIYAGYYKNIGKFGRNIYAIKNTETNQISHFWGDTMLVIEMYGMAFRTKIKITYNGKVKSDKSKFMVKDYKVDVLELPKTRGNAKKK